VTNLLWFVLGLSTGSAGTFLLLVWLGVRGCLECGGKFDTDLGYILHKSGCGAGWPEGRPTGAEIVRGLKQILKK